MVPGSKKDKKLSHEEVKEIGLKTASKLDNLLKLLIKK
jgi:purine nucleoside phosphorylase